MNNSTDVSQIVSGFLQYLDSIGKSDVLPEIVQLLTTHIQDKKNQMRVESAVALSADEKSMIEEWVRSNIGSQPIEYRLVPSVIGGFRLWIGDQCIDLSVARKKGQIYAE